MARDDLDRVVPLKQLDDFKVASGDPDVRGWEVMSADGRRIGEVEELLVDTSAMKVRYLDVEVEKGMVAAGDDRHVLIPIGYARLERERDCVIVDNLSASELGGLPAYDHRPLTRDFETSVRDSFSSRGTGTSDVVAAGGLNATGTPRGGLGASGTTGSTADDFYGHQSFDDSRFYGARRGEAELGDERRLTLSEEQVEIGKRQVAAGEVGVRKHVETEHVREQVPTMHEEAVVERRSITDPLRAGEATFREDEIRIPLHEEQVVMEKRVVPTEELVVRKQQVVENETVETDVRRERAEVIREGNVRETDSLRADADLRDGSLDRGTPGGLGNTDPNLRDRGI
jgi:photosynthetic reaction center H subunit